jgi:hypothetical protein
MSDKGVISYNIKFIPGNYYVKEIVPTRLLNSNAPHYWAVMDAQNHSPVGFAFEENAARTICLAMELLTAQALGDKTKTMEVLRAVERIRQ